MKPASVDARSLLKLNRVEALWVTKRENVRYLSGFTGSGGTVLLTPSSGYLVTDSRYAVQSEQEVSGFRVQIIKKGETALERVTKLVKKRSVVRIGFEPEGLSFQVYQELKKRVTPARPVPIKQGVESFRIVKTEDEVKKVHEAVRRAEKAFRAVKRRIRPGISEREIALSMEGKMLRAGAKHPAFDAIVASGERSAMPHGIASDKQLKAGELVVVDFGAECDGYFSDMTRTLYLGKRLTGMKRKIYEAVRQAQEAAIKAVKPGVLLSEIDNIARKAIKNAGFDKYFGHGTGHGIGLEVHELPHVAPKGQGIVREGMIFTVEPGVYIPGLGGVRIEDMALVTSDGCRILTGLSKDWRG